MCLLLGVKWTLQFAIAVGEENVGCKSVAISSDRSNCRRPIVHIWLLSIDPCVAFRLGVGSWSFTLPADDYWLVRNTRRISTHRIARPQREQEPYLVHRVVERGSWRDHGHTGLK